MADHPTGASYLVWSKVERRRLTSMMLSNSIITALYIP
jgi:hypothetical protein